jgi:hypothetical protein
MSGLPYQKTEFTVAGILGQKFYTDGMHQRLEIVDRPWVGRQYPQYLAGTHGIQQFSGVNHGQGASQSPHIQFVVKMLSGAHGYSFQP